MKQWHLAHVAMRCGYEWDHGIQVGDWYLGIKITEGLVLVRCRACALQHYGVTPEAGGDHAEA
jgi:hypothetical protein